MRRNKYDFKESIYADDLARIMAAGTGPYTRSMLAEELGKLHPDKYKQELLNEVSFAIQQDRWSKRNRFKTVRHGWYGLS